MKKFPTVGIEICQNTLPREAVESNSSEFFQKEKGKYLLFIYLSTGRVYPVRRQGDEPGASQATPIPVSSPGPGAGSSTATQLLAKPSAVSPSELIPALVTVLGT